MQTTLEKQSLTDEVRSFASALLRYFSVLLALLRREEEARRHAPFDTILNLMEPMAIIATLTGARYLLERFTLPPVGDSPSRRS